MTHDKWKRPGSDGRALCALDVRKFWHSRMPRRCRFAQVQLVDLVALARKVRS